MKLLLDEMYPPSLADGIHKEVMTVAALQLSGSSDAEVFAAAVAGGYVLLTEMSGLHPDRR